ncbi:transcriptional regulator NanR [Billgrantia endophytica]|uniref:GntR family transcriptional regulator n=1 Tax=Billgrantia endophytica TaxID=2033802 RepID=A0A2N7U1R4_9GAMM|nr:transcriptional regulator NanR [Halomonas endophytica]PMR74385.1 GntR family transcriptional regulator [Halomonas endophytica]
MHPIPKITRRKLSDEVFDRLYEMIESGQYHPGDSLPSERELMDTYGVGRPAIREAMQSLERIGLVGINHGQRPTVLQPTAMGLISQIDLTARHMLASSSQALEQLKEARVFFELGMVEKAASQATVEDVAQLKALLAEQRSHLNEDAEAFIRADMAFHTAIAAMTRNPIFTATSQAMLGWLARFHASILHWEGNEEITLMEHERIIGCIEAAEPEQAVSEMRKHLERARALYALGKPT